MQQLGHTLKEFRADCGTEYFNKIVDAWCTQHRLHFTASAPYRHQGNGRSERDTGSPYGIILEQV